MSRKIPLEATIGGAYGFLVSDFVSIIGIVWFPMVVFGGLIAGAIWYGAIAHPLPPFRYDSDPQTFVHENMPFLIAVARLYAVIVLCLLVLAVMLLTGLTRKALGLMEGTTIFYFNLGPSFWRMLAAILLAIVLLVVLRLVMQVLSFLWVHFASPVLPQGLSAIVDVLGVLTFFCTFVYVLVRLLFLLPPVVMAEHRIGLVRAWTLGGGNFWRALVTMLAVVLPVAVVFGIIMSVVLSTLMAGFPMPPFAGDPHPDPGQVMKWLSTFGDFMIHKVGANWAILLAIQVVGLVIGRSLLAAASASAYRGVTAEVE
jgi:hypothetical protein